MKPIELNREYKLRFAAIQKELGRIPTLRDLDELWKWYMENVELEDVKEKIDRTPQKAMPERKRRAEVPEEVIEVLGSATEGNGGKLEAPLLRTDNCKLCGKEFTQERKRGKPWTRCPLCRLQ